MSDAPILQVDTLSRHFPVRNMLGWKTGAEARLRGPCPRAREVSSIQWNWPSSVEPFSASVELCPPETASSTWSK